MGRRIIFIGNCQVAALCRMYERYFAFANNDSVSYSHPIAHTADSKRDLVTEADVVVNQVLDFGPKEVAREESAEVFLVPMVAAPFFWPFGGRPHPRNRSLPFIANGPYDQEMGDSFLNRLIADGVDADAAVTRYENLKISERTNLDRLFELSIEKQRQRDSRAGSGFGIADSIVQHFRSEQLFLTPHRPHLRIFSDLAAVLYRNLGVEQGILERVLRSLRSPPFVQSYLPIHPAVVTHFRLEWVNKNHTYPFLEEGSFTFPQFVRRYMLFQWNEVLQEALHTNDSAKADWTYERLVEGLKRSPHSVAGHIKLSSILASKSRLPEAIKAARYAVHLDRNDPEAHLELGRRLLDLNEGAQAETAFREAVRVDPGYLPAVAELIGCLLRAGAFDEALALLEAALSVAPASATLQRHLATAYLKQGLLVSAEAALKKAIKLRPRHLDGHLELARLLADQQRLREAIEVCQNAACFAPNHEGLLELLGCLLLRQGDELSALTALRRAAALNPTSLSLKAALLKSLMRQRQLDEAIPLCFQLLENDPRNALRHAQLGDMLARKGDLKGAEEQLSIAIEFDSQQPLFVRRLAAVREMKGRAESRAV